MWMTGLHPIIPHNFSSLNNIRNSLPYVHGRTHLVTETIP